VPRESQLNLRADYCRENLRVRPFNYTSRDDHRGGSLLYKSKGTTVNLVHTAATRKRQRFWSLGEAMIKQTEWIWSLICYMFLQARLEIAWQVRFIISWSSRPGSTTRLITVEDAYKTDQPIQPKENDIWFDCGDICSTSILRVERIFPTNPMI
jgi:hypothetical protein